MTIIFLDIKFLFWLLFIRTSAIKDKEDLRQEYKYISLFMLHVPHCHSGSMMANIFCWLLADLYQ
jgi:hypothetical protein